MCICCVIIWNLISAKCQNVYQWKGNCDPVGYYAVLCESVISLASMVHLIQSKVYNSDLWNNFPFKTSGMNSNTVIHTPTFLVNFLNKLIQNRNMPKSAHYISLCHNSSFAICTELKNITATLRWGIKTFKFSAVCWLLDTLGRILSRLATTITYTTVNCVTLWFCYVGRPGETTG